MKIYDKSLFFFSCLLGLLGSIDSIRAIKYSYSIDLMDFFFLIIYIGIMIYGIYVSTSQVKVHEAKIEKERRDKSYEEEFASFAFFAKNGIFIILILGAIILRLIKDPGKLETIFILTLILALAFQVWVSLRMRKYKK